MKRKTSRLPFQVAPRHELSGHAFEIRNCLFVVEVEQWHWQRGAPMFHQTPIFVEMGGDMFGIGGPTSPPEIGHPTRNGNIAQSAAAMDELGFGEQDGQQG
jgi:hypothetical protein